MAEDRATLTLLADGSVILGLPTTSKRPTQEEVERMFEVLSEWKPGKPLMLSFPVEVTDLRNELWKT